MVTLSVFGCGNPNKMSKQHKFIANKGPFKGKTIEMNMAEPIAIGPDDTAVGPAQHVINRAYEILRGIVGPLLGMGGITADIYIANLSDYAHDEADKNKVLDAIAAKYQVDRDYLDCIRSYPIGLIALYTLDK